MDPIRQLLEDHINELEQILIRINASLDHVTDLPPERLRISICRNVPQFYLCERKRGAHGKYLTQRDNSIAAAIAQHDYDVKMKNYVENELKATRSFLRHYDPEKLLGLYDSMGDIRKTLVSPYKDPDDIFIEKWLGQPAVSPPLDIAGKPFRTNNGEYVRSKSEKILADKFSARGIPYKYEHPVRLKNNVTIYPDFTLLNIRLRKEYIWEHFGMMDDGEYSAKCAKKIESYQDSGFFPGENLIITFETKDKPLNVQHADQIISRYLI